MRAHQNLELPRRRRGTEAGNGHRPATRCQCPGCRAGNECVARLERSESALHSSDRAQAVIARGLDVIAGGITAQAVGWYPVNARGDDQPGSLIRLSRPLAVDPEQARREYVIRYRRHDPLAPRRFLDSYHPMRTMADIGGRRGLLATLYGSELLPEFGVEYETAVYIRDGGRMLGAIRIGRTAEEGDLSDRDQDFLLRAQLFLEASYVAALEPPATIEHVELLAANGLTAREVEVARLAATGATNPEIARRLLIGEATVKTHLIHAFQKLDVRTRTELALRIGVRATD